MRNKEKVYLFDNKKNVQKVLYSLYLACAILLATDFFYPRHTIHPWEGLIGFYALYGFLGCVVLVLVAKAMRKVVMRKEDYYHVDD